MQFDSISFLLLFCITFLLYISTTRKIQNLLLLVASYIFYGWWDYRFLSLLMLSTLIDFFCGLKIRSAQTHSKKKAYLILSIFTNIGILASFKYFNFFIESAEKLFSISGSGEFTGALNIVLPVGISFYTFQSLSYSIDVYRKHIQPTRNILDFALFVSFFPQLIAGPIERAGHMLLQFRKERLVGTDGLLNGLSLAAFGLFKKIAIADNIAVLIEPVFNNFEKASFFEISIATALFAFQVYCDFSGYTDIGRGVARTLGFDISLNFRQPFLSKNPIEFWNRWHITLTSWFRDYFYFPVATFFLRKGRGPFAKYFPHLLTMILIGFWHAGDVKFIAFGIYWGIFIIAYIHLRNLWKGIPAPAAAALTFFLAQPAWLFFRIRDFNQVSSLFTNLTWNTDFLDIGPLFYFSCLLIGIIMALDLIFYRYPSLAQHLATKMNFPVRFAFIVFISILALFLRSPEHKIFVYFQF